jgi:hypothetical protein
LIENLKPSIDDFDDLAIGPLVFDFIRLMISIDLAQIEIDEIEILNHYKAGLKGEEFHSDLVQSIVEKANNRPYRIDASISKKPPIEYIELNSDTIKLDQSNYFKTEEIKKTIEATFKIAADKILDGLERTKVDGGSAGLTRHYYLVKGQNSELHDVQYKPLLPSSSLYYFSNRINKRDKKNRLKQFNRLIKQLELNHCDITAVHINQSPYILTRSLKGQRKISPLKFLIPEHQREVIRYQAQLLGNLHRHKMTTLKLKNYINQLNQHEIDLVLIKNLIKQQIQKIYSAIK